MNWTSEAVQRIFTGSSPSKSSDTTSKTPKIVGGVVGALTGSAIVAAAVFYIRRRRQQRDAKSESDILQTTSTEDANRLPGVEEKMETSPKLFQLQEMAAERTLDPPEVVGTVNIPQEVSGSPTSPREIPGTSIVIPELDGGVNSWPSDLR